MLVFVFVLPALVFRVTVQRSADHMGASVDLLGQALESLGTASPMQRHSRLMPTTRHGKGEASTVSPSSVALQRHLEKNIEASAGTVLPLPSRTGIV